MFSAEDEARKIRKEMMACGRHNSTLSKSSIQVLAKAITAAFERGREDGLETAAVIVEQIYDTGMAGTHMGEFCIRAAREIRNRTRIVEEK